MDALFCKNCDNMLVTKIQMGEARDEADESEGDASSMKHAG